MVNQQYEVGKWYKFANPNYAGKVYAKYLKSSICSRYWYFSERIADYFHAASHGGNWQSSQCREMLTDLTEIQKYLPENHEDKIKIYELW